MISTDLSVKLLKGVFKMKYGDIGENSKKEDQVHFEDQVVLGW